MTSVKSGKLFRSESYYFVEISIKLAENIRKAEQIKAVITPKHLLVEIESEDQRPPKIKLVGCYLKHKVNSSEESFTS